MGRRFVLPVMVILVVFLTGCMPALTGDQLVEYERYVSARATDAASEFAIAEAKATQAAAVQLMSQATAGALSPSVGVTGTAALLPTSAARVTAAITATAAVTASQVGQVVTGTRALISAAAPTVISAMVAPAAAARVTATVVAVPTALRTATAVVLLPPTPTPPRTSVPTAAPTSAFTPSPTLQPRATVTPTVATAITASVRLAAATPSVTATIAVTATPPVAAPITVTAGVTLEIRAASANLRGGPGTEFDIITTAPRGWQFAVSGRNADASWWQVCCMNWKPACVINSLVAIQGPLDKVPVRLPLMPDKLDATWGLRWQCFAEGCPQPDCLGQSRAQALQVRDVRWLELKRQATWDDKCGKDEDWLLQIDRYTGLERQVATDPPLFHMWMGANPGPENRAIEHFGRTLSLWCTDTRTREAPQTGGWTVLFEGQACYDRGSGILVMIEYTKRWLFTGTAGGQKYELQYFGDYEIYQQMLMDTNVPLSAK